MEDLVSRIYEAALVPDLWPCVLGDLSRLSGGVGAALFTTDNAKVTRWTATESIRALVVDFVAGGWQSRNPRLWPAAWVDGASGFVRETDYLPAEAIATAPFYREFLKPRGYGSHVGTAFLIPTGEAAVLSVERPAGPASRREVKRLDALRPHLARAAVVSTSLGLKQAQTQVETLQTLGLPGAVLTDGGRVVAANAALEKASPQVAIQAFDRLSLARPTAQALLVEALASFAREEADAVASIPLPGTCHLPPTVVHLVPVRRQANDVFNQAAALLVLTPLSRGDAPSAELLTGLFDLTQAEARVARALAGGQTIDEAATDAGVSRETVRTQLKAVLAKTGTARQSELVGLLTMQPTPLP